MAADRGDGTAAKLSKPQKALAGQLRERIADSLLPGEEPPAEQQLTEAAEFLFEAARSREGDEPVILIRTAVDDRRFMRIAIVNDDMPFLVDSVAAAVAAEGLAIDLLVHPIVPVRRDRTGRLTSLPDAGEAGEKRESMIYLETPRVDARERRRLERALATALGDVRAAVHDWPRMRDAMIEDAERLVDAEGAALLRWMADGMLTQLGHLTRRRDGTRSHMLGICRKSERELLAEDTFERAFAWFDRDSLPGSTHSDRGRAPLIIKANRLSKVHRRVPLDLFIVPLIEDGRVAALSIHAGVWTSAALATPPHEVPVLRRQLEAMLERFDFPPGSHDGKSLVHALTALPHDLIIGFDDKDIARVATAMMALGERPRPRAALVTAPLARHLFAFVWLPRDMLSTEVRLQIQQLLEQETEADTLDWSLLVEGGNLAMLRFVLDFRRQVRQPDGAAIDRRLQEMLRGWSEAVEAELRAFEPGRAGALATRYAGMFPQGYRTRYGAAEAAADIDRIRRLSPGDTERPEGRDARLYRVESDDPAELRLKIYQLGHSMPLSDAVPALENFGFRVLSELPTELEGADHTTIHDFRLGLARAEDVAAVLDRVEAIEEAIVAVINGLAEDDVFNRLVVATGLDEREASWMRALYRYLRQSAIAYTIYTVVDALRGAPEVTRGLIELFRARHDPAFEGDREAAFARAEETIRAGLGKVQAINDDRLLRLYWSSVGAILRTNAFAPAGREALAFKFDSAQVPRLPKPVPWREIWVYSRRVEGIHLRAGPVARGGLRWSDRRDDFRTEILGLMKAQRVKNAVIVPTGAKGGFYPKQLPDPAEDRDAWFAEGRASYQLFIRTLLSVTDNIVDGRVVHPECVVAHDGEDPYFVVAADKGTATFSDTANSIAEEHGFWLGDAFASGGSNGYDHKAMGITARGAWLSVRRHFLEMGVDIQSEPVRVAGCGDMSGDVFGNGMLLSKAILLVAAFDHRHIFIDPDPDPAVSWKERKRLFELPRSSWADYDEKLISKGGGVFPRSAKSITISKAAAEALGTDRREFDPESLINTILKAPVGLMWFGGIGTYVRASGESDVQVGDPANDALRVTGAELRASVVGEGANLGMTQAARIEFALHGGRVNADFIDNSAGVDCSDNEVNIKIALAAARSAGRLSEERRNALLVQMTDEVAELVLEDNRLQALALSIAQTGGPRAVASQMRLIETLEAMGGLDRHTEGLAENDEFARRAAEGNGLTRPELAVLLSSAKLALQDAIEGGTLPDDPAIEPLLLADFPEQMRDTFRKPILEHRLRSEMAATIVANRIVDRMGPVHPFELAEEEGASLEQVAAAFVAASDLLGLGEVWAALDSTKMPEQARLLLFDHAALALRSHMADLLRARRSNLSPAATIASLRKEVATLGRHVEELLAEDTREHAQAIARDLAAAGAPEKHARMVARLFAMDGAIGLSCLAIDSGIEAKAIARAFVDLGARLGLDWAQSVAAVMSPSDPWERLLVSGLARDFQQMRFDFLRALASRKQAQAGLTGLVADWAQEHARAIAQFRTLIARAQEARPVAPAMLAQIASQARNVLHK